MIPSRRTSLYLGASFLCWMVGWAGTFVWPDLYRVGGRPLALPFYLLAYGPLYLSRLFYSGPQPAWYGDYVWPHRYLVTLTVWLLVGAVASIVHQVVFAARRSRLAA